MKTIKYQQDAISELINKTVKLLNIGGKRRKIVFDAATGAGKTVMTASMLTGLVDELKNSGESRYEECAFIWLAPRQLHIQSYDKLKAIFAETRKLQPVMFDELTTSEGIQPGEILFVNWESINKENNKITRGGETDNNLYDIVRRTREDFGLPIVIIIDEEHMFWSGTADKSAKVLNHINPDVEIRVSATPRTQNSDDYVKVHREDVIAAEMIKKEVVLNPDIDTDIPSPMSINERLLKIALAKREQLAEDYKAIGSNINPLLLVQLPNDKKETMDDDDTKVAELVKATLRTKYDITAENGKLAVWLANEKENLAGLEKPDNLAQVLIFKEAIALGWDCPRAAILLIYRDSKSFTFTVQTVGRILRMPEQKHYPKESLNIGYVYTNIAKDIIQIVAADQSYIRNAPLYAKRKKDLRNVCMESVYTERPNSEHNYLGPDFKKVLFTEFAEYFGFKFDDVMEYEQNRKLAETRGLKLDVTTVNIEIPKDVHFQNEVQTLSGDKARFARTDQELYRVFKAYISTKGGQFESRQGSRTERIAIYLLAAIEDYFGIDGVAGVKMVLYHGNKPKFDFILDRALEEYMRIRNNGKPSSRIIKTYNWEVPEERFYDSETNHTMPDIDLHALEPFIQLNKASNPEQKFAEFLEANKEHIDWWYKNGDSGKMHFAIEYRKSNDANPSLFYVDFVIRMKNGTVYLFDTKTDSGDVDVVAKHNALLEYTTRHSTSQNPLIGGIITPYGMNWIYPTFTINSTADRKSEWTAFEPSLS